MTDTAEPPLPEAAATETLIAHAIPKAYLFVIVCAVIAVALDAASGITITLNSGDFVLFTVFYIVAQAIERFVEPLMNTRLAPATDAPKKNLGATKETLARTLADATTDEVAANEAKENHEAAEAALSEAQKQRAIIGWALASGLALLACGLLGLGFIEAVGKVENGSTFWTSVVARADVVLTGLAVGAGTKPLHDLISRIEKSKEKADPATAPAAA